MLPQIRLVSSDDQEFTVPRDVAMMSTTIRNLIEMTEDADAPIPLGNVKGDILEKVIEYCTYHFEHPTIANQSDERRSDDISPWDQSFCNVEQPVLFEIILAANFLDIKPLLDVCCKTVANMIKECRSPEEIRQRFNIKNDFTREEEEQIRKENQWCLADT